VVEDVDAQVGWRRVRAKLLARSGDHEEAERLALEATALAAPTDYLDLRAQTSADLAQILQLIGERASAVSAWQASARLYEQKGNSVGAGRVRTLLTRDR